MVSIIEVAEATVCNWQWDKVRLHVADQHVAQGDAEGDICLEFYQDKRQICGKTVIKGVGTKKKKTLGKTKPVTEEEEMSFRQYNDEGFLQPLCIIGSEGKTRKVGDELVINVDIIKERLGSNSIPLLTAQGVFTIGTWGAVELTASQVELLDITVTIEVRPLSSRPFSLENAKPVESQELVDKEQGSHGGMQLIEKETKDFFSTMCCKGKKGKKDGDSHQGAVCTVWMPDDRALIWNLPSSEANVVELMEDEFRRDSIVFFQTFYSRVGKATFEQVLRSCISPGVPSPLRPPSMEIGYYMHEAMVKHATTLLLLKRLFLTFAYVGLRYNEGGNAAEEGELWPYPVSSILGHGSRVTIRLEGVKPEEFINFLIFGSPNGHNWETGVPSPVMVRMAATHAVECNAGTGQLFEKKLEVTNVSATLQNLADGLNKKHLGINLPVGGFANPSAMGPNLYTAFEGKVVKLDKEHLSGELLSDVQGGHLYMRLDDFGKQICSNTSVGAERREREETFKRLTTKTDPNAVILRQSDTRQKAEAIGIAGALFAANEKPKSERSGGGREVSHVGDMTLLHMRSQPYLSSVPVDASIADVKWVQHVLYGESRSQETRGRTATDYAEHGAPNTFYRQLTRATQLETSEQLDSLSVPPSAKALKLLLEHYAPEKARFFGQPGFKTYEDLWGELHRNETRLKKEKGELYRCLEPVVIQLRWKEYVLMKMFEYDVQSKVQYSKKSFVSTKVSKDESWQDAAVRTIEEDLGVKKADLLGLVDSDSMDEEICHTVINEERESPSYPGVTTRYRTHFVRWSIRDDVVHDGLALPLKIEKREYNRGCDICIVKESSGSKRTKNVLWRWVPEFEAQKMQTFMNMSNNSPDERWAKYAFQKEGVVQPPPTAKALEILLRRCGIDCDQFGVKGYRTLKEFWQDLSVQESYLLMSNGHPLRLSEATLLKLMWSPAAAAAKDLKDLKDPKDSLQVLLEIGSAKADGSRKTRKKLPSIRKRKGESWERSAVRCAFEELKIKEQELKAMLCHATTDQSCYVFFEERTNSAKYPGVLNLYRTYLVSYQVADDSTASILALQDVEKSNIKKHTPQESIEASEQMGIRSSGSLLSAAGYVVESETSENSTSNKTSFATYRPGRTFSMTNGQTVVDYQWITEGDLAMVLGNSNVNPGESSGQSRTPLYSVLLGIESSAPQAHSPFGGVHSAAGISGDTSAVGNKKWKNYRKNNALQIPADFGGMRMRIDRKMFNDLVETISYLGIVDPRVDIAAVESRGFPRILTDLRYAEKQLMKRILSANGQQAKSVLDAVRQYRMFAGPGGKRLSLSPEQQLKVLLKHLESVPVLTGPVRELFLGEDVNGIVQEISGRSEGPSLTLKAQRLTPVPYHSDDVKNDDEHSPML